MKHIQNIHKETYKNRNVLLNFCKVELRLKYVDTCERYVFPEWFGNTFLLRTPYFRKKPVNN